MAKVHVHIHSKDADPRIAAAKKEAERSIIDAARKILALKGMLKDADDKMQAQQAGAFLGNALGKLTEILS